MLPAPPLQLTISFQLRQDCVCSGWNGTLVHWHLLAIFVWPHGGKSSNKEFGKQRAAYAGRPLSRQLDNIYYQVMLRYIPLINQRITQLRLCTQPRQTESAAAVYDPYIRLARREFIADTLRVLRCCRHRCFRRTAWLGFSHGRCL
jgi:hypothetical protein